MAISLEANSVEKKIQNLFLPVARKIADSAIENNLTIVDGHCGMGKTLSLIPLVEDILKHENKHTVTCYEPIWELQREKDFENFKKKFHIKNNIFIIDEAGRCVVPEQKSITEKIIQIQNTTECNTVAIIAYRANNTESQKVAIDFWSEIGRINFNVEAKNIHLDDVILTDELAELFLKDKLGKTVDQQIINHILEISPRKLSSLNKISQGFYGTPESVDEHVLKNIDDFGIYIEKADLEEIKRRIT